MRTFIIPYRNPFSHANWISRLSYMPSV